jgi:hypothetical protein
MGPRGYADYRSYRPWLRDEFTFRRVYCLIRERWGRVTGEFDLDHFIPQIRAVDAEAAYENLLYACHTCNLRKARRDLLDPSIVFTTETVRVYPDGTPERERAIVSLRYGAELNASEIAVTVGIEPATIRKILERARTRLGARIEALLNPDGGTS